MFFGHLQLLVKKKKKKTKMLCFRITTNAIFLKWTKGTKGRIE